MKFTVAILSLFLFTTSMFAICPGKEKRSCPGHDKLIECPNDGK